MISNDEITTLIARLVLKDRSAFDTLYKHVSPKLFGICLRLLNDRGEAEDALQEIFIKIWNRADRFNQTNGSALGWLCTVARNHCLDILRARRLPMKDIEALNEVSDDQYGPEDYAMNSDEQSRIEKCMSELETEKANAVKAAYIEGYSYAELSQKYNVPLNTMRTWLRRSLLKLRKCLDDE